MEAIRTVNLTKKYKDITAVDRLNLTIERGELFALLGVNGAGKTTTIKMLCGLARPTSGDAFLAGHSVVSETAAVKRVIGASPQETAVAPGLTALENLRLMAGVHGFSREKQNERIDELAAAFEWMSAHPRAPVSELAARCALSESAFRKRFGQYAGVSPSEYRIARQIEQAARLLRAGSAGVEEIARSVGFEDVNYFCRAFKKRMGMTALEYRKQSDLC